MNNDKIKACFDAISPDKEQKERMLTAVLKHKETKKSYIGFYSYVSLAAVFALVLFGVYYAFDKNIISPDADKSKLVAKTDSIISDNHDKQLASGGMNISIEDNVQNIPDKKSDVIEYSGNTKPEENDKQDVNRVNASQNTEAESDSLKEYNNLTYEGVSQPASPPSDNSITSLADKSFDSDTDSGMTADDKDITDDLPMENKTESKPSSGGGGGSAGGSSSGSAPENKIYDINELISSSKYSDYIPLKAATGFSLDNISVYGEALNLTYLSNNDRINVKIIPDPQGIAAVSLEEIKNYTADSARVTMSLSMGAYRADINAPSSAIEEIYTMFKSCKYFN